jgi:tRNA pseudouridine38-40 synthase
MQPGFHARKSALSRRYQYCIGLDEASSSPFRRQFEWALGKPLDLDLLSTAARVIRGEHDFRAFAAKTDKPHYRCRVIHAEWSPRPDRRGVSLQIEADRFLQRMVRMLVGTMVDIGLGRRPCEDMTRLLRRVDNAETSPPAPPQGLYFAAAVYPPELFAESPGEPYAALHLA